MEKALSFSNEVYITGDINIDCKINDFQNNTWKHIVELHDLQQLIKTPSRVTAHTETIINHLYASNGDFVYDVSVPAIAISYHHPICFTRSASKNSLNVKHIKLFNTVVMLNLMKTVLTKTYLERWQSLIFHAKAKILISTLRTGHRPLWKFSINMLH